MQARGRSVAPILLGLVLVARQGAGAEPGPAAGEKRAAPPAGAEKGPAEAPSAPGGVAPGPGGAQSGPPAPAAEPPPPGGPPPQYYVEPQRESPGTAPPEGIYEPPPPPPPVYEPPPPSPPHNAAPKTALWVGARVSWLVPFGSLWIDGFSGPSGMYFRRRSFASYASPGPAGEIDVGARLSRRYMLFALFEHASLGSGSLDDKSFGGQERGASNFYGAGLRFSTDPGAVGFALEIALGYRDFRAYFGDGTKLTMTDGFLDARLGLGADIRMSRCFSLSPMVVLGGGSFGTARWSGPLGSHDALDQYDETGEYGTIALQLGGHFDVY